jgi:cold shock CspA family protein
MVPEEGFGFIDGDDGHEYFFHRSALNATRFEDLAPGVPVFFRIGHEEGDRPGEGLRAVFVRMTDAAEPTVDPPFDQIDQPPPGRA